MTYKEAINYIEDTQKRGSILGLDRMKRLLSYLGNPQNDLKIIHIAGTNGKGSTANFLANILAKASYKVGMYYSPALEGIKDHFRIDGQLISDDEYAICVGKIKDVIDSNFYNDDKIDADIPTQFEIETAIAFYWMKLKKCDFAVIETGLGGREDATNVCDNKELCVITSISMDHMDILGDSLYEIARCKAGIIKGAYPVVAFDSAEEVIKAIREEALYYGSEVVVVKPYKNCRNRVILLDDIEAKVSMQGAFQIDNAYLAMNAAIILRNKGYNISNENIAEGIETAKWQYRFEKISEVPEVYVDGAHNESAALRLKETLVNDFANKKLILVMGMFKDKEYEKVIAILAPLAESIYSITTLNEARALSGEIIKDIAEKYCDNVISCKDIGQAAIQSIKEAKSSESEKVIIACGSLSYLARFKEEVINSI